MLSQAAEEMFDWHGSGMSVMEMSHRGKEFISIHAEADALLRELFGVPANYKVLLPRCSTTFSTRPRSTPARSRAKTAR